MIGGLVQAKDESIHRRKLDSVLKGLDSANRAALEEAMGDPEYTSEALSRALRGSGVKISSSSVRRYRRDVLGVDFA